MFHKFKRYFNLILRVIFKKKHIYIYIFKKHIYIYIAILHKKQNTLFDPDALLMRVHFCHYEHMFMYNINTNTRGAHIENL